MKKYVDKDKLQEFATKLHNKQKTIFATQESIAPLVGSPLVASLVADMTDTTKIYVYVGSETGYTAGNWYYYDGSAWTSGGVYNAVAIETDDTLTVEGMAADAKATGDQVSDLKSAVNAEHDFSTSSFSANDGCLKLDVDFEHGHITNGAVVDVNYRAITQDLQFTGDYMDIVMEDASYYFAVFYYDTVQSKYIFAPYFPAGGYIRYGRFRVFDNTKKYRVVVGYSNGSTLTIPLDTVKALVKIYDCSESRLSKTSSIIDMLETNAAYNSVNYIPLFQGRVDGAGYSMNVGEMVTSPINVSTNEKIKVSLSGSTYRYAVYSIDSDGEFHILSGGWITGTHEYDGIAGSRYIVRIGRANGDTAILTQSEFTAIKSALSIGKTITVNIIATPRSRASIYLSGKKVSITGDSRSTFQGTQPTDYPYYYPNASSGLTLQSQMWWQRVLDYYNMTLLKNVAWSGGLTGIKNGFDALASACNDSRISALADGATSPDIIIAYTGVNDWINNIPLGTYDGTGAFPTTYETFSDAVAVMINKIQTAYPNADVWLMANSYSNPESTGTTAPDMAIPKISTRLLAQYNDKMGEICKKMCISGYINLEYCGVNHMNIQTYATDYQGSTRIHGLHYNAAGHKKIADFVITEFEKYYNRA